MFWVVEVGNNLTSDQYQITIFFSGHGIIPNVFFLSNTEIIFIEETGFLLCDITNRLSFRYFSMNF